jgi:hypothetical protein
MQDTIVAKTSFPEIYFTIKSDDLNLMNDIILKTFESGIMYLDPIEKKEEAIKNYSYRCIYMIIKDKDDNMVYSRFSSLDPCYQIGKRSRYEIKKDHFRIKATLCLFDWGFNNTDQYYYLHLVYPLDGSIIKSNVVVLKPDFHLNYFKKRKKREQ